MKGYSVLYGTTSSSNNLREGHGDLSYALSSCAMNEQHLKANTNSLASYFRTEDINKCLFAFPKGMLSTLGLEQ
jgi:hypothetical protein